MYLFLSSRASYYLSVKIKPDNIPETIEFLRTSIKKFSPAYPFEYRFFDEAFDRDYRNELRLESLFSTFALLAIIIACLGILGLATFTAAQRTKEIGIRKVLGASVTKILSLLSGEFFKLILISNVVAWPVSYFIMDHWLQNFEYRMTLSISHFLFSAVIVSIIMTITISYRSYKAATTNPVDSLRNE